MKDGQRQKDTDVTRRTDGQTGGPTVGHIVRLTLNVNAGVGSVWASMLTRHIGVMDGALILRRN